jgi:thioredoxin 1
MDELEEIRAKRLADLQSLAEQQALRKATKPVHLTDANFDSETALGGVALVDLWAAWCGPCLRIAPVIEQLAADYAGKIRVYKLNIDENPLTPGRFGVQSIPTLMIFKDGKLVDGIIGAVPRQEIERVLQRWT